MSSPSTGMYNPAPGNVSNVDIHGALYPNAATKVLAYYQPWFCMGSTATGSGTNCNGHVQVGYNSNDSATVAAQMNDMIRRKIDGVVVDWYSANSAIQDGTTLKIRDDLDPRCSSPQNCPLLMTIMEDQGAWAYQCGFNGGGVDQTQCITDALTADLQYLNDTYFGHASYLRVDPLTKLPSPNGRPVVMFFVCEECFTNPTPNWGKIWGQLRANTQNFANGNGLYIFRNAGAFTHVETDGGFGWVARYGSNDPYGLVYLDDFYDTSLQYKSLLTFGGAWKGFDNTNAPWQPSLFAMGQQCGNTWLQTLKEMTHNNDYSAANQLPFLGLVSWNDYDEGTPIEAGIDNCLSLSASVSGTVLSWNLNFSNPSGNENTVDHYLVYDSTDGQNLTVKATLSRGTHAVDLKTLTLAPGTHKLYVQAVGGPSIKNQMSGQVGYTIASPSFTLTASPTNRNIYRGQSTTYSIKVNPLNGFNSSVTFSVSGMPSYATASFSPQPSTTSSTLTVRSSTRSPRGTFTLRVTGTSGSLAQTTSVSLQLR